MHEILRNVRWLSLAGWSALVGCQANGGATTTALDGAVTDSAALVATDKQPAEVAGAAATVPPAENSSASVAGSEDLNLPRAEPSPERAWAGVLDDLMEISSRDPEAARQLRQELDRAQPSHWPLIVQHFRAGLAFRQELLARDDRARPDPAHVAGKNPGPPTHVPPPEPNSPAIVAADSSGMLARSEPRRGVDDTLSRSGPNTEFASHRPHDPSATAMVTRDGDTRTVTPASADMRVPLGAASSGEPICAACSRLSPQDWQDSLRTTIRSLETALEQQTTQGSPVRQQVYLRLLYMMAGEQDASFAPIAGIGPTQTDYWLKQLFALNTYLDVEGQPDDGQRAAAARHHLDGALRELSELSAISVRNLVFAKSVSSFGIYEVDERESYRPGERISLYAEVDNFRSQQREEGYYTSLSTNYSLRQLDGDEIEGGRFPDVIDECQNRRRDFHIQYGIRVPGDLEPGEYELRLEITDNLSHKTGYATQRLVVKSSR